MWAVLAGLATALGGTVVALSMIFKERRTVQPGHIGVVMRFNKTFDRKHKDPDGIWRLDCYVYPGDWLWWMIPGIHTTFQLPVWDRTTDDITIPIQWPDGTVSGIKVIMTYDVSKEGVLWAARKSIMNHPVVVTSTFHDLVGDALECSKPTEKRAIARNLIMQAVRSSEPLMVRGVINPRINLNELSIMPMTQLTQTLRELAADGGFQINPVVPSMVPPPPYVTQRNRAGDVQTNGAGDLPQNGAGHASTNGAGHASRNGHEPAHV